MLPGDVVVVVVVVTDVIDNTTKADGSTPVAKHAVADAHDRSLTATRPSGTLWVLHVLPSWVATMPEPGEDAVTAELATPAERSLAAVRAMPASPRTPDAFRSPPLWLPTARSAPARGPPNSSPVAPDAQQLFAAGQAMSERAEVPEGSG